MSLGQSWKMSACLLVCTALFFPTLIPATAQAADDDAKKSQAEDAKQENAGDDLSQVDKDRIAKLIQQLDDDSFDNREDASTILQRLGAPAVPALVEAASNGSFEAKVRAKQILNKLIESSEESTLVALRKIADDKANGNANTAKDFLETAKKAQTGEVPPNKVAIPGPRFGPFGGGGGIRIVGGGGIRLHAVARGGGFSRSVVKNADGSMEIKATEGEKKVHISIAADGAIKMKVTEKKDGKPAERAYEFENEKSFQKKNPEAFKVFEKYRGAGGVGIKGLKIDVKRHDKMRIEMRKKIEDLRKRQLPPDLKKKVEQVD